MDVELTPEQRGFRERVIAFTKEHVTPEFVEACDEEGRPPLELMPKLAAEGWLAIGVPPNTGVGEAPPRWSSSLSTSSRPSSSWDPLSAGARCTWPTCCPTSAPPSSRPSFYPGPPRRGQDGHRHQRAVDGLRHVLSVDPRRGPPRRRVEAQWREDVYDRAGLLAYILVAAVTDPSAGRRQGVSVFLIDADSPASRRRGSRPSASGKTAPITGSSATFPYRPIGYGPAPPGLEGTRRPSGPREGRHRGAPRRGHAGRPRRGRGVRPGAGAVRPTDGKFQAVSHKLAEMAMGSTWPGTPPTTWPVATTGEDITTTSAMVKAFTTETYKRAVDAGLQVLGGAGYLPQFRHAAPVPRRPSPHHRWGYHRGLVQRHLPVPRSLRCEPPRPSGRPDPAPHPVPSWGAP